MRVNSNPDGGTTLKACACPCCKKKMAWAINIKVGRDIVYGRKARRGSVCQYDCTFF